MIDTSIQFNNHNSYKATEDFWQKPFGVELMTHITIAAIFYATSPQSATNRIRVIFLDENGARVQVSNHAIGIGIDAARQSVTVAVPAGAKKAQIGFLAGNYWWAEAKAEEGETATAYAINAAGQLTYLTPNGVYTHTLQAKQIILTGGDRLPDRLLTLNANIVSLRQGINGSDAKIASLTADMLEFSDTMSGKTSKLTADGLYTSTINADQITGGSIRARQSITFGPFTQADKDKIQAYLTVGTPLSAADRARYDVNCDGVIDEVDKVWVYYMEMGIRPSTVERTPTIRIEPQSADFTGGIYFSNEEDADISNSGFYMANGTFKGDVLSVRTASADTMKAIRINLNGGFIMSNWGADAPFTVNDGTRDRLTIYKDSTGMTINDSSARLRMAYDSTQSYLRAPNGNLIGVDSTGVYKQLNGVKTYL